jgi:hypothetical protein
MYMAQGQSGRVVIEIEPELKRRLYAELALSSMTLKDWFIIAAEQFLAERQQPRLFTTSANSTRSNRG